MTAPTQQMKDVADTVQSETKEVMHDGQAWLSEADHTFRQAMREHPLACLFVALGIGYSIGRLIAKR